MRRRGVRGPLLALLLLLALVSAGRATRALAEQGGQQEQQIQQEQQTEQQQTQQQTIQLTQLQQDGGATASSNGSAGVLGASNTSASNITVSNVTAEAGGVDGDEIAAVKAAAASCSAGVEIDGVCFPGGLIPREGKTGAAVSSAVDFFELYFFASNNTGKGQGGSGNQRSCGTCVNAVIASTVGSSVAAARRVDARQLNISHNLAYHCGGAFGMSTGGAARGCTTGWSFEAALGPYMAEPFKINSSCAEDDMLTTLATTLTSSQLLRRCERVKDKPCATAPFACTSTTLSAGLWEIQLNIRRYGAVMTRMGVTTPFVEFMKKRPRGVYNGTDSFGTPGWFWHAVTLIGYDNAGGFWYARNSWGKSWGDGGMFRIAYGVLDIGHPEATFAIDCTSQPNEKDWWDPWPVVGDPRSPGCYLYTAGPKDTISGMADHFSVDILKFVEDNTRRRVIPTRKLGAPPRNEPQLGGPWGGAVFQVCNIPEDSFARVAKVTCGPPPDSVAWLFVAWPPACGGQAPGSECAGTCAVGFTGSPRATCGSNGQWAVAGDCTRVTCTNVPSGGDASWSNSCAGRVAGTSCFGSCSVGWTGSPSATCGNDGQWAVTSSCSPVTCSSVPSGGDATWSSACAGRIAGSTCSGDCVAGFVGTPSATCGNDGRWLVSNVCMQVKCSNMPLGGDATWSASCAGLAAGSTCSGTCPAGFKGAPRATCSINGQWEVSGCTKETCNGVPSGGGATWSNECAGRSAGSTCSGSCLVGWTGSPSATCFSNGQWVMTASCSQGKCSSTPTGGGASWSAACAGLAVGGSCIGRCAPGYTGTVLATCGADGNWVLSGTCTLGTSEVDLLLAVKAALDPTNKLFTDWTLPSPYCNWKGVTCTGGAITRLSVNCLSAPLTAGTLPGAEVWQGLRQLTHLDLRGCRLGGQLPASLPPRLEYLDVSGNNVTNGLPPSWASPLKQLYVDNPRLGGTLPTAWSSVMTSLEDFSAISSGLSGTLPASWSGMLRLRKLRVTANSISGTLPASWASLTSMTTLDIAACSLSGTIPSSWSAWVKLTTLDVRQNARMTGCVPRSIASAVISTLGTQISGVC